MQSGSYHRDIQLFIEIIMYGIKISIRFSLFLSKFVFPEMLQWHNIKETKYDSVKVVSAT